MTTISRPRPTATVRPRTSRQPATSPSEWSLASVGEWLRSPVAPYYLVLASAGILTALGLVMVLSASGPRSFVDSGSSYTVFLEQVAFAGVGIVLALVGSRVPVRWWKRMAFPAILLALGLQAAVFTGLGVEFQGNRNWISIAGFSLQPSEFGKLALVVFGAAVLANRRKVIHRIVPATAPFVFPFGLVLVGLVLQGHDLGTAMIMVAIVVGMLWAAGLPAKWFVGVGAVAAGGVAFLAAGSANRMQRIQVWLGDICDSPHAANGGCFQKVHAEYALADGGWWGLGLGASREKWGLLPEPHNDFILAIIGEELGLPGTMAVLLLFAVLAYACFRIVSQSDDPFIRLATAGVMIWLLGQALLNIGSVIGMLPIIGVPLPLVSSGGSALIAALIGVGLLLALARSVPGAAERLKARPSALRRTLAVVPTRRAAGRGSRR
ncbi:putative lipid II flippase FtsW [Ornithinimicrobium pekingense]|uniref:Probable peptidoglycan glycosyltransferase FtsW n=1 Tax=Ornithinimicrobium pekingense TaxID=384677 RepID=A0ABQ2F8C0_9MICO|nr:putative lipid II flippase FtsW [Ornithinimicrobium pekingense]GGK68610.1 cell division protein FtsW [Ornithinimicrobium pekingense]